MFRFSIRELMLVTLVVALGVAWCTEHRRLQAALNDAIEATEKSEKSQTRTRRMDAEIGQIHDQLAAHGLGILRVIYDDGRPGATVFKTR